MNILKRLAVPMIGALLFAGCNSTPATDAPAPAADVCIISGEPVDADSPSVEYMGQTVRFCCDNCKGKFERMDDAAKKAAVSKQ